MKALILAHSMLGCLKHAIAEVARNIIGSCGHQVAYHDHYGARFDPDVSRGARKERGVHIQGEIHAKSSQDQF